MKTEEIVQRLRDNARQYCPPKFPVERMVVWVAADALEAQAREIESVVERVACWFWLHQSHDPDASDLREFRALKYKIRDNCLASARGLLGIATPSTTEETSE